MNLINKEPASVLALNYVEGNFLSRLGVQEDLSRDKDLEDSPTIEEITRGKLGSFDLMISPAEGVQVTDPTSVEYTGYFISGGGLVFDAANYVAGNVVNGVIKTGFTDVGTLYAIDAIIEGTIIIGPGSDVGGWEISATQIFSNSIKLDSSIPAILIGSATATMVGNGVFIGEDTGIYKMRIGNPAGNYLLWDGTSLTTAGQWIQSAGMNPALQEWQTNIVFSSVSDVQVNWTSGSIRLSDGTTYSIVSGNTSTMAALTYIYLDIAVSSTILQITTTYTLATGDGKILVAAAQNATAGASVLIFSGQQPIINGGAQITALSILAGNIAAGAITATKISVTSLSAITANMGSLTIDNKLTMNGASGAITIGTTAPTSATVGTGIWIDRTGIYSLDSNVQQTTLTLSGLTAGGGKAIVDVLGFSIIAPASSPTSAEGYKFYDSLGLEIGGMYAEGTGLSGQILEIRALANLGYSQIFLDSQAPSAADSFLTLRAISDTTSIILELESNSTGNNIIKISDGNSGLLFHQLSAIAGTDNIFNEQGLDINTRIEGDNDQNLVYIDAGNDRIGFGTAAPTTKLHTLLSNAATNTIQKVATIEVSTSGTAAAGLGAVTDIVVEDAGGNSQEIGYIGAKYSDPTNTTESAKAIMGLIQGGAIYEYPIPLLKYVAAGNINIASTETTIFDLTVPIGFLTGDNLIRFQFETNIIATTTRTITWRIYFDDTLMITQALHGTGANTTSNAAFRGKYFSTGSNAQKAYFEESFYNVTAGAGSTYVVNGTAAEATTSVKNIKVTCQLSGAVTTALASGIIVEFLTATQ